MLHPGFERMDVPRDIAAGVTGVATGLLGGAVPIIGAVGGVIMQLVAPGHQELAKYEYITEGVVDGSVALLAYAIFTAAPARPQVAPCRGCTQK